jgi:hypothetical protein
MPVGQHMVTNIQVPGVRQEEQNGRGAHSHLYCLLKQEPGYFFPFVTTVHTHSSISFAG